MAMRKITFRADEKLIEEARLVAKSERTTLSAAFCKWLKEFASQSSSSHDFDGLMTRLRHVKAGRRFTRDEMNRRRRTWRAASVTSCLQSGLAR
jgi:hypothetical protein